MARRVVGGPADLSEGGRLLVRLPNWVGDACMAMPTLVALRAAFPAVHITLLGRPSVLGIARLAPADSLEALDDQGPLWVRPWKLRRASMHLRRLGFDAAVTLAATASSGLLLRMAGIPTLVGFGRGANRMLLSHPLDWSVAKTLHRAQAYLSVLEAFGRPVPALKPVSFVPSPESTLRVRDLLVEVPDRSGPLIALAVGSVGKSRRWPAESFAQLADALARTLKARCVLVGAPSDQAVSRRVVALTTEPLLDLVGLTPLEDLPALLATMDLVVSNDTGAAHVASLVDAPTIVFFGAGDQRITGPVSDHCQILSHPVACAPCLKNTCRFQLECLTGITPQRVLQVVATTLAAAS